MAPNREIPLHENDGLEGGQRILTVSSAQDAEIAARIGQSRGPVKSIEKVMIKKAG